jgi:hypothetical protein
MLFSELFIDSCIDQLHISNDRPAVFTGHIFDRVAYLVNDTTLHFCFGINTGYGFFKTTQVIDTGDQDIFNTSLLQIR